MEKEPFGILRFLPLSNRIVTGHCCCIVARLWLWRIALSKSRSAIVRSPGLTLRGSDERSSAQRNPLAVFDKTTSRVLTRACSKLWGPTKELLGFLLTPSWVVLT